MILEKSNPGTYLHVGFSIYSMLGMNNSSILAQAAVAKQVVVLLLSLCYAQ